ncbi:hypothetical protein KQX54_000735 [Cotesia glomerata]|uniref:Uncharacterized protein n=1 Tax=Cotesia glomerata TaxID=32391 RepID=A0AAV7IHX9_COTGL|nr:hypothetical protein KQX54_000735 [Cotesia glomerata]
MKEIASYYKGEEQQCHAEDKLTANNKERVNVSAGLRGNRKAGPIILEGNRENKFRAVGSMRDSHERSITDNRRSHRKLRQILSVPNIFAILSRLTKLLQEENDSGKARFSGASNV